MFSVNKQASEWKPIWNAALCGDGETDTRVLISDNSSVRHSSVERDDDDVQLVEVFFLPFSSTHFLPFLEQIQTHSSWKTVGLLKKQKKTDVALGWMFITTKRCSWEILARCYFIFCSISLMSWITKRKYINEGGRERNKNKTNSSPLQYITLRNI